MTGTNPSIRLRPAVPGSGRFHTGADSGRPSCGHASTRTRCGSISGLVAGPQPTEPSGCTLPVGSFRIGSNHRPAGPRAAPGVRRALMVGRGRSTRSSRTEVSWVLPDGSQGSNTGLRGPPDRTSPRGECWTRPSFPDGRPDAPRATVHGSTSSRPAHLRRAAGPTGAMHPTRPHVRRRAGSSHAARVRGRSPPSFAPAPRPRSWEPS